MKPQAAALPGRRLVLEAGGTRLALQVAGPPAPRAVPLLMLHGLDAAASAAMLAPLFAAQAGERPVLAPDLPGFGASAAPRLDPPTLVRAVLRCAAWLHRHGLEPAPDLLAVGDACEFAALAAVAAPRAFRSLLLVGPGGLEAGRAESYVDGVTQAHPLATALLAAPALARAVHRGALAGPLLAQHLRRQWGAAALDTAWLAHARACRDRPGAWRGAIAWAGGLLATQGIAEVLARVARPVWVAHGTRAPAPDLGALSRIGPPSNWTVDAFDTGPLPFREDPARFAERLREFSLRLPTACAPTTLRTPRRQPGAGEAGTLSSIAVARR